jgi:uncharacterized protein (DUF2249 family)
MSFGNGMRGDLVTLDVREDIREGREPFSRIMRLVSELTTGQKLLLIAPFEPIPLLHAMARRGFSHSAKRTSSGDWEVLFTRLIDVASGDSRPAKSPTDAQRRCIIPADVVNLDVRGLEPPQPMIRILEVVTALPVGAELRARTDRRPLHLYSRLEERGYSAETQEESDGSFLTCIRPH